MMADYNKINHLKDLNNSMFNERMNRAYDYGYEDGLARGTECGYKRGYENGKKSEQTDDLISRQAVIDSLHGKFADGFDSDRWWNSMSVLYAINKAPSVKQEPKMGHWMRKTKVDGVYDIAGVKTWGVKCQCDKCDFTTTVIEDFGYYKYCPNCGCRMIPPQDERDKE